MLSKLNNWLKLRAEKKLQQRFNQGVAFAERAKAMGEEEVEKTLNHVDMSSQMGKADAFDAGIKSVLLGFPKPTHMRP